MSTCEADHPPPLYTDTLADDEPTLVYPMPWWMAVQTICLDDPDSWPPLPVVEPVL